MNFPFGKFGPAFNPVGEYCADSRNRVGQITRTYRRTFPPATMTSVRSLDGTPWPEDVALSSLQWLKHAPICGRCGAELCERLWDDILCDSCHEAEAAMDEPGYPNSRHM